MRVDELHESLIMRAADAAEAEVGNLELEEALSQVLARLKHRT